MPPTPPLQGQMAGGTLRRWPDPVLLWAVLLTALLFNRHLLFLLLHHQAEPGREGREVEGRRTPARLSPDSPGAHPGPPLVPTPCPPALAHRFTPLRRWDRELLQEERIGNQEGFWVGGAQFGGRGAHPQPSHSPLQEAGVGAGVLCWWPGQRGPGATPQHGGGQGWAGEAAARPRAGVGVLRRGCRRGLSTGTTTPSPDPIPELCPHPQSLSPSLSPVLVPTRGQSSSGRGDSTDVTHPPPPPPSLSFLPHSDPRSVLGSLKPVPASGRGPHSEGQSRASPPPALHSAVGVLGVVWPPACGVPPPPGSAPTSPSMRGLLAAEPGGGRGAVLRLFTEPLSSCGCRELR